MYYSEYYETALEHPESSVAVEVSGQTSVDGRWATFKTTFADQSVEEVMISALDMGRIARELRVVSCQMLNRIVMTNSHSDLVEDLTNAAERATTVDIRFDRLTGERVLIFQFEGAMPAFIRMSPDLSAKILNDLIAVGRDATN